MNFDPVIGSIISVGVISAAALSYKIINHVITHTKSFKIEVIPPVATSEIKTMPFPTQVTEESPVETAAPVVEPQLVESQAAELLQAQPPAAEPETPPVSTETPVSAPTPDPAVSVVPQSSSDFLHLNDADLVRALLIRFANFIETNNAMMTGVQASAAGQKYNALTLEDMQLIVRLRTIGVTTTVVAGPPEPPVSA